MVKYVFLLISITVTICAAGTYEGKCNKRCGRLNQKPNTSCIQSGKPEQKSCHDPDGKPYRAGKQNFCQCDPGTVRQCKGGNKFDCVKPEDCDMSKPKCTDFL